MFKKISLVVAITVGFLLSASCFAMVGKFAAVKKLPTCYTLWRGQVSNVVVPDSMDYWMKSHPRAIAWVPFKVLRAVARCADKKCIHPEELEITTVEGIRLLLHGRNCVKAYLANHPEVLADTLDAFPAYVDSLGKQHYSKVALLNKVSIFVYNGKFKKYALPK